MVVVTGISFMLTAVSRYTGTSSCSDGDNTLFRSPTQRVTTFLKRQERRRKSPYTPVEMEHWIVYTTGLIPNTFDVRIQYSNAQDRGNIKEEEKQKETHPRSILTETQGLFMWFSYIRFEQRKVHSNNCHWFFLLLATLAEIYIAHGKQDSLLRREKPMYKEQNCTKRNELYGFWCN